MISIGPSTWTRASSVFTFTMTTPSTTPDTTLATQMRAAAEKLRSVVQEQMQKALDYDEAGVRWLDGYIERARLRDADAQWKQNLMHLSGAFLGECTIACLGGQWAQHGDMTGVRFDEKNMVFPHHKVHKQFDNGAEAGDSILGFYQANIALFNALSIKPLTLRQELLLEFSRDSRNRIFVRQRGADASPPWALITQVRDRFVELYAPPGQGYTVSMALTDVQCFYVCTPVLNLLHADWVNKSDWDTLPPNILTQVKSKWAADTSLTLNQLERGKQFIEVSHGPSNKTAKDGRPRYSTSLKNISLHKVQITRFGGFIPATQSWRLANVTGDFYTDGDFREWYGQKTEWLLPGETACDDTNYGTPPVLWAYYGVTDTGESFIAGKVME